MAKMLSKDIYCPDTRILGKLWLGISLIIITLPVIYSNFPVSSDINSWNTGAVCGVLWIFLKDLTEAVNEHYETRGQDQTSYFLPFHSAFYGIVKYYPKKNNTITKKKKNCIKENIFHTLTIPAVKGQGVPFLVWWMAMLVVVIHYLLRKERITNIVTRKSFIDILRLLTL